ncbi:hypothetical protein CSC70_00260 [Pseudoxanthomonas kalamensis DSM 18571]|uniref:glycoside hydrolase family 19 protein n=1 Tax=Pseudoxanthomonas kalamensis TaxID=289483 RepID=UPI001391DC44|nr:glycoside hydrolase family 19 protein [Pseudoxanthomonas kalamensis]KAF1712007.1 hypothetical protein CSC70_00260 [Pseudoxanthomonas kalamensis DSM 18571]
MADGTNPQPDPDTDAQTETATTPDPVKKFAYPFPKTDNSNPAAPKQVEVANPREYYDALATAPDGFYPIGANGQWHGGIHFGAETATSLAQDKGIRCIADGEVIAYRIDEKYPQVEYPNAGKAKYSTGFVLVKHRLQPPEAPASTDEDATQSQTQDQQEEEPSLTLYSLYMHLLDWEAYKNDTNMGRPSFWDGDTQYRVTDASTDEEETLAPNQIGIRVRDADKKAIAILPRGAVVTLGAEGTHRGYFAITGLVSGATVPAGMETGGYVYKSELGAQSAPSSRDTVVVLETPHAIKAKDMIGHLGQFQRYKDTNPLASSSSRPLVHLEVFTGDDVQTFITQSRARAAQLDAKQKTLLKIDKGAVLAQPVEADTTVASGVDTALADDSPKTGRWAKVTAGTATVWVERNRLNASGARTSTTGQLPAWTLFPLQIANTDGPTAGFMRVAAVGTLENNATEADGTRWWEVEVGTADGSGRNGWAREKGQTKVSLCSPWDWPGFEVLQVDSTTCSQFFAHRINQQGLTAPNEQAQMESHGRPADNGALFTKLEQIIDSNADNVIVVDELQAALRKPWLAQAISRLIARYDSEWAGPMSKWDGIDQCTLQNNQPNWAAEKTRIEKLLWWDDVKGQYDFPDSPAISCFHPVGLIGTFNTRGTPVITVEMLQHIFTAAPVDRLRSIVNEINENIEDYKLDTPLRLSHFFAQVREEVGNSASFTESLNYSPSGLIATFSYFSRNPQEAQTYGRTGGQRADQEAIANRAYGNRNGNGDIVSGDGWRYRGRGLKMTTGRGNYQDLQDNYHLVWPGTAPDFVGDPDLLGTARYAVQSAVFFWIRHGLYQIADGGPTDANVDSITRIINRHTASYAERRGHFTNIWTVGVFTSIDE